MHYKILSNKWRPKNLEEIFGQDEVVYTVKNIINSKSIHHAYLICGNHGVGKTSLARILVKYINCELGITLNPCNKCACCVGIDNDENIDSIEIDAASKTRVEDIKDILTQSHYKNIYNRFKTYIIDECHMLSINSFNFLLKILEEPVENTIYILITTRLEKIPKTIISRCIFLNLRQLSKLNIKKRLIQILLNENIYYENSALDKLLDFSDGSMRQSINLLEKLNKNRNVTEQDVNSILGLPSNDILLLILKYIYENNINKLLKLVKSLLQEKNNIENILIQIQIILYKIILYKIKVIYNKNDFYNSNFLYLSEKLSFFDIEFIYKIFAREKFLFFSAPNINIGFELILLNVVFRFHFKAEIK